MKSFFRQQKAHTKPTGGVSKKAAAPHHHQKASPELQIHPASGNGFPIPHPIAVRFWRRRHCQIRVDLIRSGLMIRLPSPQTTAPAPTRGGASRRRRSGSGRPGSSTWTCATGPASASRAPSASAAPPRSGSPRRRRSSRSAPPTTSPASGRAASRPQMWGAASTPLASPACSDRRHQAATAFPVLCFPSSTAPRGSTPSSCSLMCYLLDHGANRKAFLSPVDLWWHGAMAWEVMCYLVSLVACILVLCITVNL